MKSETCLLFLMSLLTIIFCPMTMAQTRMCNISENITYSDISPDYEIIKNSNYWLQSQNPSAIGVITMPNIGTINCIGNHLVGKLHRVMETNAIDSWGFGVNSYHSLNNLNLWGDFIFSQKYHNKRNWSDNFEPYNGNPYQVGSNLKGNYIEQTFDFKVKISSHCLFHRMWFGLGFDYSIGDLSRTQDPRSKVQFIDLNIIPGIIVNLGKYHKIGASFRYRYRKEKNNTYISKAQDSKEYLLYLQEGLGVFKTLYSTYFDRRVKGNYYGGELQYDFSKEYFSLLITGSILTRNDILEDANRKCPGDYASNIYKIFATTKWQNSNHLHLLSATVLNINGKAQKNSQQLVTETSPAGVTSSYFKTIFTAKSYTNYAMEANLEWKYYKLSKNRRRCQMKTHQLQRWFIGAGSSFFDIENKYVFFVPQSMIRVRSMEIHVSGGSLLFEHKKHRLIAACSAGCIFNLNGLNSISSELTDQVVRLNVIDPDYKILCTNGVNLGANLRYIFPLLKRFDGYLSIEGHDLISISDNKIYRAIVSISIGLLRKI